VRTSSAGAIPAAIFTTLLCLKSMILTTRGTPVIGIDELACQSRLSL
jgi:hypothetical protein